MVGPQHALTLKLKGQRSNPNPKPRVRVLTFAMGMGQNVEQRECVCRYDRTFFYLPSTDLSQMCTTLCTVMCNFQKLHFVLKKCWLTSPWE